MCLCKCRKKQPGAHGHWFMACQLEGSYLWEVYRLLAGKPTSSHSRRVCRQLTLKEET